MYRDQGGVWSPSCDGELTLRPSLPTVANHLPSSWCLTSLDDSQPGRLWGFWNSLWRNTCSHLGYTKGINREYNCGSRWTLLYIPEKEKDTGRMRQDPGSMKGRHMWDRKGPGYLCTLTVEKSTWRKLSCLWYLAFRVWRRGQEWFYHGKWQVRSGKQCVEMEGWVSQ